MRDPLGRITRERHDQSGAWTGESTIKWIGHTGMVVGPFAGVKREVCSREGVKPLVSHFQGIRTMASREGPFAVNNPDWQQTCVAVRLNVRDGIARVVDTVWGDSLAMMRLYALQLVHSAAALVDLTSTVKNSWSNLFNANQASKRKVNVAVDVAASLADAVVVLHGGNFLDAYTTVYNIIRPRVTPGLLGVGDREVLTKIFGDFKGKELTLDMMEEAFLESHPGYAHGCKRKHDARVLVQVLLIPALMAALPEEFTTSAELQEKAHA